MIREISRRLLLSAILLAIICGAVTRTGVFASGQGFLDAPLQKPTAVKVLNNGGRVLDAGGITYLLLNDDPQTKESSHLATIDDTGKLQILTEADCEGIFYLNGHILYSSSANTSSFDIASHKSAPVTNGDMCFVDDDLDRVYISKPSWDKDKMDGMYSVAQDGSDLKCVVEGECQFLAREGDYIYFGVKEGNRRKIFSTGLLGGEPLLIASEISLYAGESYYMSEIPPDIADFGISEDRIIYSYGYFEGSAAMFFGFISSVKKDGSDKKTIGPVFTHDFTVSDGWLFRNYWNESQGAEGGGTMGAQRIMYDFSEKKNFPRGILLSEITDGHDIVLFKQDMTSAKPDLCISEKDGENTRVLVRGSYYSGNVKDGDYLAYENIEIVGEWIYFDTQMRGYRGNLGWRDEIINSETNRIRLDGTGYMTLARFESGK